VSALTESACGIVGMLAQQAPTLRKYAKDGTQIPGFMPAFSELAKSCDFEVIGAGWEDEAGLLVFLRGLD
jgi:hypothetical protein